MSRRKTSRHTPTVELVPTPAPPAPCPGSCNRAWRAAEQLADEERTAAAAEHRLTDRAITDHGRRPRLGAPVWCVDVPAYNHAGDPIPGATSHTGCVTHIRRELAGIPRLAAYLRPGRVPTPASASVDDGRGGGNARTAATFPTPSPAWDLADEVIRWGCTMADTLATRVGDNRPAFTRLDNYAPNGHTVIVGAIAYIGNRFAELMTSPEAESAGVAIRSRHRTLERMVGADTLTHHISGECPHCHRRGRLYRRDGDDFVRCGACPAIWDWDHFQLLVATVLQDETKPRRRAG